MTISGETTARCRPASARWPPARPCRARPGRRPTGAAPGAGRRWPDPPARERGARPRRSSRRGRSRSLPGGRSSDQRPGSTRRLPAAGPGREPRRHRPAPLRPRRVPSRRGAGGAAPRRPTKAAAQPSVCQGVVPTNGITRSRTLGCAGSAGVTPGGPVALPARALSLPRPDLSRRDPSVRHPSWLSCLVRSQYRIWL